MKVGVIGTKRFQHYGVLSGVLDHYNVNKLICDDREGTGQLVKEYANEKKINLDVWKSKHYKRIDNFKGIINQSDIVIFFWDGEPGPMDDCIEMCKKSGIPHEVYQ